MVVTNIHRRILTVPAAQAGRLIDTLASAQDALWPRQMWPAMEFDRPLSVGADGGHGPVRYSIVEYDPGRSIVFCFKAPAGFDGTHRFDAMDLPTGSELRHTLRMKLRWPAHLSWPLVFRWLHDALLEDCLARAQAQLGDEPVFVRWSPYVRLLRWIFSRGAPRPQLLSYPRTDV